MVKKGIIIGRGWTQPSGRPHAEVVALNQAGSAAKGATAYVTLEPCSHFGKTPPCADALIDEGVEAVHTALIDPDPRVSGKGIQKLEKAGCRFLMDFWLLRPINYNADIYFGLPKIARW